MIVLACISRWDYICCSLVWDVTQLQDNILSSHWAILPACEPSKKLFSFLPQIARQSTFSDFSIYHKLYSVKFYHTVLIALTHVTRIWPSGSRDTTMRFKYKALRPSFSSTCHLQLLMTTSSLSKINNIISSCRSLVNFHYVYYSRA